MEPDAVSCVQAANSILGESPCWDTDKAVLYWVDIRRPAVYQWTPNQGQTGQWPVPYPIGCVGRARNGTLIVADSAGFALMDLRTGALARIASPEASIARNRFNDGKVDRAGRFWAGTMDDQCIDATGSLYRLDADHSVHRMDVGFICSNGLGWSPDSRTMYFTDSMRRTIWAYDFDLDTGSLGARRVFAQVPEHDGVPDGLTVDSDGFVWSAIWDGWRIIRYAPDGTVDKEIPMPVQRPTSCMFGGPTLRTLYVTSSSMDLAYQSLRLGPLGGGLFALQTDVKGIPEATFAG